MYTVLIYFSAARHYCPWYSSLDRDSAFHVFLGLFHFRGVILVHSHKIIARTAFM